MKKKQQPPAQTERPGPKRGSAADAARQAGVSIVTVSRAFNNSPLVTDETRERVLAAAREVGYRPNVAARALSKGLTETVAFVLNARHLMGEFYSEALAGFHSVMSRNKLQVLLSVIPENEDTQLWMREFLGAGWCSACAVHPEVAEAAGEQLLMHSGVPMVLANYVRVEKSPFPHLGCVGFNHGQGIVQAVRHLALLGHKKIAFLGGSPGAQDSILREQAFRTGMADCGLKTDENWIVPCGFEYGPQPGLTGIQKVLSYSPPTAVICASDNIAGGAAQGAKAWGQSVPKALSVIGFDDCYWCSFYDPPLTTIRHQGWDLGVAVADMLMRQREDPARKPEEIILPTELILRGSTAPPLA